MNETRQPFKIAAGQIRSIRGDLAANLAAHEGAIRAAAGAGVSVLVFPELSLIGYEPDIAASLAFTEEDVLLQPLQRLAVEHRLTLMVGAPVHTDGKPAIGTFVFGPDGSRRLYRKMHLGTSELPFFSIGTLPLVVDVASHRIGVGVCADSSQRAHADTYYTLGARIYAASVFLTDEWYRTDAPRLQKFAEELGMLAVMANQAASIGTYRSVGRSAVWAPGGSLLVQAEGAEEVLVVATAVEGNWKGETLSIGSASHPRMNPSVDTQNRPLIDS
jgi:predicted amidohydrolase